MAMWAHELGQNQVAARHPDDPGRTMWIEAKPEPEPLLWRLRDAWRVLTGEARCLRWRPLP